MVKLSGSRVGSCALAEASATLSYNGGVIGRVEEAIRDKVKKRIYTVKLLTGKVQNIARMALKIHDLNSTANAF